MARPRLQLVISSTQTTRADTVKTTVESYLAGIYDRPVDWQSYLDIFNTKLATRVLHVRCIDQASLDSIYNALQTKLALPAGTKIRASDHLCTYDDSVVTTCIPTKSFSR